MRNRPAVALLIETFNAYARGLLAGISAYVRQHTPWSIYLPELGRGDVAPHASSRRELAMTSAVASSHLLGFADYERADRHPPTSEIGYHSL